MNLGAALQRSASGRELANGPGPDQPIEIFPGLTHFTDAISALPKELVRHFTLLKEVDAKISTPEDQLRDLITACLGSPYPSQNSAGSGILLNNALRPVPVSDDAYHAAVFGQGNMPRRQLFHETASHINNMLIALDEKNHVINTANENERTNRRDGPSAAAQQAAEEAAARSESRKQAVQAKKNQRNQCRQWHEPPPKRRKVEKPVNGGLPMERAMSTVFGSNGSKPAKSTSPRTTPAPESQKKRKALPTGPPQAKKSKNGSNAPPQLLRRLPGSSRARQTPAQSATEVPTTVLPAPAISNGNNKARPSSSASNKPNGTAASAPDTSAPSINWVKPAPETKPTKEVSEPPKPEDAPAPAVQEPEPVVEKVAPPVATKKDTPKPEEPEKKPEPAPPIPAPVAVPVPSPIPVTMPTVTTKSGRASKPSTPALATFQEAARSRSSRAESSSKRSHKKATVQNNGNGAGHHASGESANKSPKGDDDEEGEVDADEPTYCYCNSVSYGSMVACDAEGCEKEWFHLECAGLKVPPKQNVKWYCEDCKEPAGIV
ncbi:unnamed protein product [Parascedosporium putredinis]|uniref:Chromatin modification-related protein n=1 Tax=Parascedosporium putredinis TaxID=1442378 RepID=A0A9P1GWF3_9PEZI|nr:unnamed protein product [Parascedosporium putredinis]CAI7988778.1 unnamed protein product [Parascedosporium putredinis]